MARPNEELLPKFHYIPEWAEKRGMKQADLMRETGADKSTVSRWFTGTIPKAEYLLALAGCLGAEETTDLFRHPDDDWMAKLFRGKAEFFRNREKDELERMMATLETAFPRKAA